jgi:hypothetical protein
MSPVPYFDIPAKVFCPGRLARWGGCGKAVCWLREQLMSADGEKK